MFTKSVIFFFPSQFHSIYIGLRSHSGSHSVFSLSYHCFNQRVCGSLSAYFLFWPPVEFGVIVRREYCSRGQDGEQSTHTAYWKRGLVHGSRISHPISPLLPRLQRKWVIVLISAEAQHHWLTFSEDVLALVTGAKYVKALIPAVVNIVYKKLLQYDITARAFQTRSTSFEGPLDEVLDENSPQILHRKMFLKAYLIKLCSDPTQMEFWEYLDKVGWVFYFTWMNEVADGMTEWCT